MPREHSVSTHGNEAPRTGAENPMFPYAPSRAQPAGASRRGAIFLDKDGTLVEDVPYNVDPAQMRFAPGAREGLQALARCGLLLIVVSNQSGIALCAIELSQFQKERTAKAPFESCVYS